MSDAKLDMHSAAAPPRRGSWEMLRSWTTSRLELGRLLRISRQLSNPAATAWNAFEKLKNDKIMNCGGKPPKIEFQGGKT